jgi:hypothetical protein
MAPLQGSEQASQITQKSNTEETGAISQKLEEFVAAERSAKLVVDETPAEREARAIQSAIIRVLDIRTAAGQIALAGCWEILRHEYYRELGYQSYEDWARTELGSYETGQYLRELSLIAQKVIAPVHYAEQSATPYLDRRGETITATRILETPGLLAKLKIAADAVFRAVQNGEGEERPLLAAVVSGSRRDVEKARNQIGRQELIQVHGIRQLNNDGSTDVYLPSLDPRRMVLIEAMLGEALLLSYSPVAPYTNLIYTVEQEGGQMATYIEATKSITQILSRQPEMRWTLAETAAKSPEVVRGLHSRTNAVLEALGFTDEQRYALCSRLFERDVKSTNDLLRAEAEALERMLRIPAFRDSIQQEYT